MWRNLDFGIACILIIYIAITTAEPNESDSNKLFLTEYIKSGKIEAGRLASSIHWRKHSLDDIPCYSGYLTTNETTNANLFFWFIPAMVDDPEDAPVMLWLNGAGTSSMYGLFVENGPFKIKKRGRIPRLVLRIRKNTWARRHSMLYMDAPLGMGFSFANHDGYARTLNEVTSTIYDGLVQFFTLFPDFVKQDFYLAGEDYAAKYIPKLGLKINQENSRKNTLVMNLKGVILGGPVVEPLSTPQYGDFYYHLGLVDDNTRTYFNKQENLAFESFQKGDILKSYEIRSNLLFGDKEGGSYFSNVTGFQYFANLLSTSSHKKRYYFSKYLNFSSTRRYVHVGDQPFHNVSNHIRNLLIEDLEASVSHDWTNLLNLPYMKFLVYVGQLDMITPHTAVFSYLKSIKFNGTDELNKSTRTIIRDSKRKDVAGYYNVGGNVEFVILRNAGHHAPQDEGRWLKEIVETFTYGNSEDLYN